MQKHCSGSGSGVSDAPSRPWRLALMTALCVIGTLLYVFVLLVPAWRTVRVDRALIGSLLANQSGRPGGEPPARMAKLWDALARDPLLRSRAANAFRECLTADDGYNVTAENGDHLPEKSPIMKRHLVEALAGVVNATDLPTERVAEIKHHRDNGGQIAARERCWFLDMNWSTGDRQWDLLTAAHRAFLLCSRALFLIAVCLLLCYCVCLICSLYTCFASRMPSPCRAVLLIVHCLSLSQLVALAILQDLSAGLAESWLLELLAGAGFPDGYDAAVDASRGVCSLVLVCLLCLATVVQMLLILLPILQAATAGKRGQHRSHSGSKRHSDNPIVVAATAGREKDDEGDKMMRECDDAEDTNPLI